MEITEKCTNCKVEVVADLITHDGEARYCDDCAALVPKPELTEAQFAELGSAYDKAALDFQIAEANYRNACAHVEKHGYTDDYRH